jgi:general secretion pathway protein A
MQPDQNLGGEPRRGGAAEIASRLVSSRRRALERLLIAVRDGRPCPLLITGEAGSGKTWLARHLIDNLPVGWQAASVEVTAGLDARGFLQLIGQALGLAVANRLAAAKAMIQGALQDASIDGRRWLLVVDEAHRCSPPVWDEILALSSQLGRTGGFEALILLGETELARELDRRRLAALAARLGLHLHLMPLDLDEARELLGLSGRPSSTAEVVLETLHRDARGNPARLRRLADLRPELLRPHREPVSRLRRPEAPPALGLPTRRPHRHPMAEPKDHLDQAASPTPAAEPRPAGSPSLVPSKPPIRLEEGLVEVGWEGDLETETGLGDQPAAARDDSATVEPGPHEEPVDDRYAALQAWTEWTRNRQGGTLVGNPAPGPERIDGERAEAPTAPCDDPPTTPEANVEPPASAIRIEALHSLAPYGDLFTRLHRS